VLTGGVVVVLSMSGCGSTDTVTEQAPETTAPVTHAARTPRKAPAKVALNNPAQQPNPSVTAGCNEVPTGHACRASTTAPSDPNESPQHNCDTNIVANSNTSCDFAENAFYEYYKTESGTDKIEVPLMVYSPTTHQNYELGCEQSHGLVGCTSSPTSDDIYLSFPTAAVLDYTESQASAYARTRDVGHPGAPAASAPPEESSSPGGGHESSGEDEVGSYSHSGDEAFCSMHECIGDFEGENGYIVECSDGTFSHAGGISGSCSDHGGNS
jgi:hypothetical protein